MNMSMNAVRIKGWEKRFVREIASVLETPFNWASNNCGHIVGTAIRTCHGDHPLLDFLGQCRDEASTLEVLGREGGFNGMFERYFEKLETPLMGQQADVGIIEGQYYNTHAGEFQVGEVGCVFLDGQAVGLREKGVFRLPVNKVVAAYRV